MIFGLTLAVLGAALLLGGGTQVGFLGDFYVQLMAVPLLLISCRGKALLSLNKELLFQSSNRFLVWIGIIFAVMVFVQLVPLPASWFPNRAPSYPLDNFLADKWLTLSLTPSMTWAAIVSVIPPLAIFAGVSQLDTAKRFKLVWFVIGIGALELLLGLFQIAEGPQSYLRFFEFTNDNDAVGFFANRNHFAALLYTTLVFTSVWFISTARGFIQPGALNSRAFLWFVAAAALLLAIVAGLAMARSRAGIFLTMLAIIGIAAMFSFNQRANFDKREQQKHRHTHRIIIVALSVAVLFAVQFGLHRIMTRFGTDPLSDLRWSFTPATVTLAVKHLPFGTGLGSFESVYKTAEQTSALFSGYANRAHNDWAEFLLEGGIFGLIIMGLFLWWFIIRIFAVWRGRLAANGSLHLILQRAATLVIALLLAHSLVDYPLHTTAMASIFAFSCALLLPPSSEAS